MMRHASLCPLGAKGGGSTTLSACPDAPDRVRDRRGGPQPDLATLTSAGRHQHRHCDLAGRSRLILWWINSSDDPGQSKRAEHLKHDPVAFPSRLMHSVATSALMVQSEVWRRSLFSRWWAW